MPHREFSLADLRRFRKTQRLAYDCAQVVQRHLQPGITERQACALIAEYLGSRGVASQSHRPFAWFGDRTAFRGFWSESKFFPSDRALKAGMPVILDIAPIMDGCVAHCAHSFSCGDNADFEDIRKALMEIRDHVLLAVRARRSFAAVASEMDGLSERRGYRNLHRVFPSRRLVQRLTRHASERAPSNAYALLPGLWSVGPHIATRDLGIGATWKEILVVTDDYAYWLDDGVPHCTDAAARGWWKSPAEPALVALAH